MHSARKRREGSVKKSKRRREDEHEDVRDEDVFHDEEPTARDAEAEGDAEAEDTETAASKRLRIAKAYIAKLKASADPDDDSGAFLSDQLQQEAREASGRTLRPIAAHVNLPEDVSTSPYGDGRLVRGHRLAATAVALSHDDATAFSATKCGALLRIDVETGKRFRLHRPGDAGGSREQRGADWVYTPPQRGSAAALYAVCASHDGRYLAAGGGDKKVHVWDLRSGEHVQAFGGHKDLVSGVAFRHDSSQLFSSSFDRSVKLWSVDDRAYMDSLFGHQSEVTAVDVLRQERCVTAGFDRTCRVWKVPEEAQLIFRASGLATDCVRYVSGTEWVSGCYDGSVALWSQMKKKPVCLHRGVHRDQGKVAEPAGPGCADGDAAGWVQSVAVCPGADLVASGAGDGLIRLWAIGKKGSGNTLLTKGALPARGFVNGLAIAKSGRFLVAAVGQEPRLGRWLRDGAAKNGTLIHQIPHSDP